MPNDAAPHPDFVGGVGGELCGVARVTLVLFAGRYSRIPRSFLASTEARSSAAPPMYSNIVSWSTVDVLSTVCQLLSVSQLLFVCRYAHVTDQHVPEPPLCITSAVLLATELAQRGAAVTIIDADPNQPVLRWSSKPGKPENLTVIGDVSEETLIDAIDDAARKTAFVIVDLEGTASVMVAHAMTRSDLVIIPTKGSELDGIEAAKVIQFINRQERAYHRKIPFAVLFTQTNPAVRCSRAFPS
jgi:hypothetical protein